MAPAAAVQTANSTFSYLSIVAPFAIATWATLFGPCSEATGPLASPSTIFLAVLLMSAPVAMILAVIAHSRNEPHRRVATFVFCGWSILILGFVILVLAGSLITNP